MSSRDETRMGGQDEAFHTTQWTRILCATAPPTPMAEGAAGGSQATAEIIQLYWRPVYAFLRRRLPGLGNEQAKDLTQGFFCDIVVSRNLVQQADRSRGRFRSFLLAALERYLIGQYRRDSAQKRCPAGETVSLDGFDEMGIPARRDARCPMPSSDPRSAFAYDWAVSLVGGVLTAVADGCARDGRAKHWEVFNATVVRPALEGVAAPPLSEMCSRLGIESEAKASNMSTTVKRRFQAALRSAVQQYAETDEQVDEEIRDLMRILSTRGASS